MQTKSEAASYMYTHKGEINVCHNIAATLFYSSMDIAIYLNGFQIISPQKICKY